LSKVMSFLAMAALWMRGHGLERHALNSTWDRQQRALAAVFDQTRVS